MTGPEQIQAARLARGWNRQQLAEAAQCSRGTILNLEVGHATPGADVLERIGAALDISGDALAALLAPGSWTSPESAR